MPLAAFAASAYVTTKLLVKTALDREQPGIMKRSNGKISGGKRTNALQRRAREASDYLMEQEHEKVEITGYDGTSLIGHFFPCENAKEW